MPEPSNDSLVVTPGVLTGNGGKSQAARENMAMRGPFRSSADQLNDKLGGFDPPAAEIIGSPSKSKDPTGETKGE